MAAGGCPEHSQEGALCTPEIATRRPTSPQEVGGSMGVPARVEWPFRVNRCQGYKRCPHGISWWLPTTQVMDMDQAGFLKQTPLFSGLSDKEIASVLGTAREREFAAGDSIISDGQEGGVGFYLILSGTAEARKGETLLAEFGPGAYFGEMALLLEDTPRTADVVATSDTRCLAITQWDLRALIEVHPEIGVKIMAELAKRLRDTDVALSD